MRLLLERAWVDDVKIHDAADLRLRFALRSAVRTRVPRRAVEARSREHGTIDRSKFYDGQVLDLAGYANGGSVEATADAVDALAALFALGRDHVLRFRRKGRLEDEQVTFREANGFDAPAAGWADTARWSVTLFAGDPRVYSSVLKQASYDPSAAAAGGGLDLPLDFALTFPGASAATITVENQGSEATPPQLAITGPATSPIIDNETTGKSIYTTAALGATDSLVIDIATKAVQLNGVNRPDLITAATSTLFELAPGPNRLRLRGTGFAAGSTRLFVTFRDARI